MKQLTMRTLVRLEKGKGILWKHQMILADDMPRQSLGMETITALHTLPFMYEVETFEEDGATSSRFTKNRKQAERAFNAA